MKKNLDLPSFINWIDERITKLQQARQILAEESGMALDLSYSHVRNGTTRKQMVVDYITKHGPAQRRDLIASGIPIGTVSYLLSDKKTFKQLEDGRWDLAEGQKKK